MKARALPGATATEATTGVQRPLLGEGRGLQRPVTFAIQGSGLLLPLLGTTTGVGAGLSLGDL